MRERVLSYIRHHSLMRPGDRVGVAVSGGADSVALLRLLLEARAELGIVLSVVHFNHRIRGADADADQQFVRRLAQDLDLEFHCDSDDTPAYATSHKLSLEAAARTLRYSFFDRLTADATVHRVATAHTCDDQAETVLMRFLRGSGTRGFAGIYPELRSVVRPLLEVSRAELRAYLDQLGQPWREDQSNADVSFARNRLRHEVLPLLRQLNPSLDETLSQTAEIARTEEGFWSQQVRRLLPAMLRESPGRVQSAVLLPSLLRQPTALQRRLVRALAERHGVRLEFHHVEQVLTLAAERSAADSKIELPHGWEAVRCGQELWLECSCQTEKQQRDYDFPLPVPGEVEAVGRRFRASLVRIETETSLNRALLDRALAARLRLRNWHAGDRYWPAHTREPKKLKELLQARHIPREQKPYWPVVASGDEIVWVPGFAAPERFRAAKNAAETLLLEEVPRP